jgi:hypothetical protein
MRDPLTIVRDRYLAADSKFGFALRRRRTALKRQVAVILGNPVGIDRQMLAYEYLCGNGIEIGALHNPLRVPRRAHVRYVDRMSVPAGGNERSSMCSPTQRSSKGRERADAVLPGDLRAYMRPVKIQVGEIKSAPTDRDSHPALPA